MAKACSLRFFLSLSARRKGYGNRSSTPSFHSISLSIRSSFVDGARDNRLSRHGFRQGSSRYSRPLPVLHAPFHNAQGGREPLKALYRGRLKGICQVVRMMQASSGRSGKQQQQQNSPNLAEAF